MAERLYYSKAGPIDPIALVTEKVAIWIKSNWHLYEVKWLEPLPRSTPMVFDMGAVVAGAPTGDTILRNLDQTQTPPAMAQLRFYPVEDLQVTLKIGQAEARFTSLRFTATADRFTRIIDPCLHSTEFIVLMGNTPYVDVTNPTDYDLTVSRVAFFGYRYTLDDLHVAVPTREDVIRAAKRNVAFIPSGSD